MPSFIGPDDIPREIGKLLNCVFLSSLIKCNKKLNLEYTILHLIKSDYDYIH